ncbi:MAG TPA: penicillin-binding protein 2 [Thermoanaerobaculia bacterium]|nr:penicillin-binding protein 2 [Thermoanaerobaculia bacterium]
MTLQRRRILLLAAGATAWSLLILARLAQIQILRHDEYVLRAVRQQERTVTLTPMRGSILDRRGRLLAESVTARSIYADPQTVQDPAAVALALSRVDGLPVDRQALERRLARKGEFAWIARQVEDDVWSAVEMLDLPGIHALDEHRRTYPNGTLGSGLLGWVGIDGEGLAGVEHSLNRFVRGTPGVVTLLRDARKGMYLVGADGASTAVDGHDIYLTLDEVIQHIAERSLRKTVERYGAKSGSVVVLDPSDGAILAMASWPTFDPNHFGNFPTTHWRNRVVQDVYEPGSTFKVVTAAAALEEGVVTPSQIIDCGEGFIEIANTRIREHDNKQFGLLSFEQVLAQSSNVGTIEVARTLGEKRLDQYARRFGFGSRTGVELPGEASGILRPVNRWSALSTASISIGQEIAVTPLQMTAAMAVVANGGRQVRPHIVERVVDGEGNVVYSPPPAPTVRVISEKSAAVLNEMLKNVVTLGTGREAALAEHVVAGKTGTAQKAGPGGYLPNKTVASFAGYVPADRPRLAILVVIDEPKGSGYGGAVAAPAFREIAEASLRYLEVAPGFPRRELRLDGRIKLAELSQPSSPGAVSPAVQGEAVGRLP